MRITNVAELIQCSWSLLHCVDYYAPRKARKKKASNNRVLVLRSNLYTNCVVIFAPRPGENKETRTRSKEHAKNLDGDDEI